MVFCRIIVVRISNLIQEIALNMLCLVPCCDVQQFFFASGSLNMLCSGPCCYVQLFFLFLFLFLVLQENRVAYQNIQFKIRQPSCPFCYYFVCLVWIFHILVASLTSFSIQPVPETWNPNTSFESNQSWNCSCKSDRQCLHNHIFCVGREQASFV